MADDSNVSWDSHRKTFAKSDGVRRDVQRAEAEAGAETGICLCDVGV